MVINRCLRAAYVAALSFAVLHAPRAFGGSVGIVTNFNAPNNPAADSGFSYGSGLTPAGFAALTSSAQDAGCIGVSSYCLATGQPNFNDANIEWNGTGITQSGGIYPANMIRMDSQGVGAIVQYTAPTSGIYSVSAIFTGDDPNQEQVDTYVFANGVGESSTTQGSSPAIITSLGGTETYNFTTTLNAGQKLDFITTGANVFLGTGLSGTITTQRGCRTGKPGIAGYRIATIVALRSRRGPSRTTPARFSFPEFLR